MRAFLAIDPDAVALSALHATVKQLQAAPWARHVRWVGDENFHLTLRFLGEINETQKDEFVALLTKDLSSLGDATSMILTLTEPCLFPKPSRPRVIACLVEPNATLLRVAQVAESCAVCIGLPPEQRPFSGHITLGRTRDSFPRLTSLPVNASLIHMRVEAIALFKSDLTPRGAVYTQLARLRLDSHTAPG